MEEEKTKFNNDPTCKVMVAQITAVKYGHTLDAGGECNTLVYFENSYSLDDRAQSAERSYSPTHKKGATIIDFYASSVEKSVIKALQRKESISKAIMEYKQ